MSTHLIPERPQWSRSPDGPLAGVCEGLGRSFGIEPWLLRGLWLASVLVFGFGLALYVILALCLPRADRPQDAQQKRLLGVCLAISRKSGVEVGLVRALTVLLALASAGVTVLVYVVLAFVFADDREGSRTPLPER